MSRIVNGRNGKILADKVEFAKSLKARLVGLLGKETLPEGEGMLIARSGNSIHTFFMKFAIDTVFISKSGEVKYIQTNVKPWRLVIAPLLTSTDCLELPAGTVKKCETQIGDTLRVEA